MTENKIKPTISQVIYCLKAESERYPEVCEECQLYGEVGCDHCYDDVTDIAIKSLKELEQYRAIGTVEELQELKEKSVAIVNGEWIDTQPSHCNGYYKNAHVCSNCHDYYTTEYEEMKFCPNCGAKMRAET